MDSALSIGSALTLCLTISRSVLPTRRGLALPRADISVPTRLSGQSFVSSDIRQGCMLYELMPTMAEARLLPLVERFAEMIGRNKAVAPLFAAG